MKMKYFFSALLGLALSVSATAQSNPGIDYMTLGETDLAKDYFMKTMRQAPVDSYYYLGQIAFESGKLAEAKTNFEHGLAANPESVLNAIGLAKLELKSEPKEAAKALDNIKKKNKKDIVALIEIARAFSEAGMNEDADKVLVDARKANRNSPLVYIFEGQRFEKAKDAGKAAAQFEQAINFDPECTVAYIKGAQVYEGINPGLAIEKLTTVLAKKPDYMVASRYLAKLYYERGFYAKAIDTYSTIFAKGQYTIDELIGYAASKYFTNDYEGAVELIRKGLSDAPQNFVLNRLLMYSDNELKLYEEGETVAKNFFAIPRDSVGYLAQDHMAYGNILINTGKTAEAVAQYLKATEVKPVNNELNKEIAVEFADKGMYEYAGDFYGKYNVGKGEEVETSDYFLTGRYYYLAGDAARRDSTLAETAPAILAKADSEFSTVIERLPDNYLGYLWRGRTNALLDPETSEGLAKPYYEKVVELLFADAEQKEEKKAELVEACVYMCYYHYLQFDAAKGATKADEKAATKSYCEKLLEVDPTNSTGTQILEVVK